MTSSITALAEEWVSAQSQMARFSERGARRFFNGFPGIESAFHHNDRPVTCVDEGIATGIHVAGSGILLDYDERTSLLTAAEVTEFTTHDNCGAFKLAFPNESNPNRACREWGEREAVRLGLPHRHIEAAAMDRPPDLHTATAIYYDGSGRFNRLPGMPRGFTVTRRYSPRAAEDLALCLTIAFGEHGFHSLFTYKTPMRIVVFDHPDDRALRPSVLVEEAQKCAAPYGDRVTIEMVRTAWFLRK